MKIYKLIPLLVTAAASFLVFSTANAGIAFPKPKQATYSCPNIPSKFEINDYFYGATHSLWDLWKLQSYGNSSLQYGAIVTIETAKNDHLVKFTSGAVYASIFGKTLTCYGTFQTGTVTYKILADTQVPYKTCIYEGEGKFLCTK